MHRHPIDALSLAFGLVFVGLAVAVLAPGLGPATLASPWLWPAVLIVLGAALLLSSLPRPERSPGAGPTDRDRAAAPGDDPENP